MSNIRVLDCTLRDGGYCNNWNFGHDNIHRIIDSLSDVSVEVIECGFLSEGIQYDCDVTKFSNLRQIDEFIPEHSDGIDYVLMMNYGEYNADELPCAKDTKVDGVRVAFHKNDRYGAIELCRTIIEKGYQVFVQPMVSMLYSDEEFLELIELVNDILPYAFYIVDSFGTMNKVILSHYFDLANVNLKKDVMIGFHSHNNMQSAFSNAQFLVELKVERSMIIDCSIYGMGRGAGNLNLELFLNELNGTVNNKYHIKPILQVMDEVINRFYEEKPWGYSLPNYLSAVHMIHPNYADYLSNKRTLSVEDIDNIFSMMSPDKGYEYDERYIDELYIKYMSKGVTRTLRLHELREKIRGRNILLVAPGKSVVDEKEVVIRFVKENNPIIISINCECPIHESDYIFISNIRRFKSLNSELYCKTIATSNIKTEETYASVDYYSLLNGIEVVGDNAGLMAIEFVKSELGASSIFLAGFDGFSHDVYGNFGERDMSLIASGELLDRINAGIYKMLEDYKKQVNIKFVTSSMFADEKEMYYI